MGNSVSSNQPIASNGPIFGPGAFKPLPPNPNIPNPWNNGQWPANVANNVPWTGNPGN